MGRELQHLLFWEQHCCLPSAVGAAEWSRHGSAASRALKGNGRWQEPGNTDARSWNFMDSIWGHFWGQNVWLHWKRAENEKGCWWFPSTVVYAHIRHSIYWRSAPAWSQSLRSSHIFNRLDHCHVKTSVFIFVDHNLTIFWCFLVCLYLYGHPFRCAYLARELSGTGNRFSVIFCHIFHCDAGCCESVSSVVSAAEQPPQVQVLSGAAQNSRCLYLYPSAIAAGVVWLRTAAPVCLQSFFWQGYGDA